jgi:lipoyl-dependent peroxiredoxin subunit D
MSIDALCERLPAYAKDIRANLAALAEEDTLEASQKWGCFLACACAVGEPTTVREIEDAARLGEAERTAARAAAAIGGMNNVYYRALTLMTNTEYKTLPARLRMGVISDPGVPGPDFELWSLAVAAINGCGACLDSHEAELRKHATAPAKVQAALRIAAVVNATGRVLAAEAAREPPEE